RMYVAGNEAARAKVALLRAGKLGRDESRVLALLDHVLQLLGDPRPARQAIHEAPLRPAIDSTPPPMPSRAPPVDTPRSPGNEGFVKKKPGMKYRDDDPRVRQTTPKRRFDGLPGPASRPTTPKWSLETTPKPASSDRQTTPKPGGRRGNAAAWAAAAPEPEE